MQCQHCHRYWQIPLELRMTNEKLKEHKRECYFSADKKWREKDSPACEKFIPAQYIHCESEGAFIALLGCINRFKKKINDCGSCEDAEKFLEMARGRKDLRRTTVPRLILED